MPPPAILDPAKLDLSNVQFDRAAIEQTLPQRHEFALLDAVVFADIEQQLVAGYYDVRTDGWWARGHIPGRPLFPGVLMIEVAAQLVAFATSLVTGSGRFIGFAGVDETKFRGAILPPARLIMVAKGIDFRSRRAKAAVQGFVDGTMVFESIITGMPI